ncbi:alanine racemase [Candidatus Oscillochloris fontis]|uniref:alanine racemase n=1 Tax=Candidatus Oscillochloris fontis TaxID=2496868 RepID=UPI00101D8CC3|nr:alanine racemase [Candidatus Oscillochloris fontis]
MITLDDLLAAGARLHGSAQATSFMDWSYDSRLTASGECFVALRTPRADGHDFIPAAIAAGATGILCSWPPADPAGATVLLCDDPQATLLGWAAERLANVQPTVVGITGSVGKTTARRAAAAVLARRAATFQSRRSFNSLLGLPVALARLEDQHRFAVLELGSDRRGEIAHLATFFPPQIALVTAVEAAHLRSFGTLEAIAAEKGDLLAALPPKGVAIINGDSPLARALMGRTKAHTITYGQGRSCDLSGRGLHYDLDGTMVRLRWCGTELDVHTPLIGIPGLYAALAGVAVGLACGMDLEDCVAALPHLEPVAGRLRPLSALGGAALLDDSFSAAPPAALAALDTLAVLPARRRIAVIGSLAELPVGSEEPFYRELGTRAASSADLLIVKGDWGVVMERAARHINPNIAVQVVDTTEATLAALPPDLGAGDLVLVKGGAESRMERVVARLVDAAFAPPLVRQEPAWRSVRVGDPDRPTWLRINLDALADNVRRLRELAGVPLMAVLKADAYGHGAIRAARAALGAGAEALAVATLGEARTLRTQGITARILLLGYTPPWQADETVRLGLDCTLFDHDSALALSNAAQSAGRPVRVHVKVDTGMARLGLAPSEVGPFLAALQHLPGLEIHGLYTHFASADEADLSAALAQLERFNHLLNSLIAAGLRPPLVHAANSAATLRLPAARFDMVRPGIACYGLRPSPHAPLPPGFHPVLSFHSEVAQVRELPAGVPVSYGGTYITHKPTRIATIPAGYADGVRRAPPWQSVLIAGQRASVVGRICMDYTMVDVSHIPGVRRGDAVVLIGHQGEAAISADEVAEWLGTISYEVLTSILPRVPREVA